MRLLGYLIIFTGGSCLLLCHSLSATPAFTQVRQLLWHCVGKAYWIVPARESFDLEFRWDYGQRYAGEGAGRRYLEDVEEILPTELSAVARRFIIANQETLSIVNPPGPEFELRLEFALTKQEDSKRFYLTIFSGGSIQITRGPLYDLLAKQSAKFWFITHKAKEGSIEFSADDLHHFFEVLAEMGYRPT
jgi:hypothetical protein